MFVFVGLGSNQGDRAANLRAGISSFARILGAQGLRESPVYESAPMYLTEQPPFLNMVISGAVAVELATLLHVFKEIEGALGRDLSSQATRNGPRPLDMDILLAYEGQRLPDMASVPILRDTPELIIPHPRMAERAFVLFPLRDLAPNLMHPTLHRTIAALVEDVATQDVHKLADGNGI
ncbi:MAG: 2-amino-4-hydroxy-6-hydroxymethyldihydropteridine diphosphokinase [Ktedonobacterales bacterium]|nr:2-amino-4-hydroxy-6-hydroxymethyldihydropteridine diphosphokinase [Ktedonobacterales bacterium]